jgi:hypothetical protein
MSFTEKFHNALNTAFFERDLLRNERIVGDFRRRHVTALTKAMAGNAPGKIEQIPVLEDLDPEIIDREFIRKRRPVVLRGAAKNWPAAKKMEF